MAIDARDVSTWTVGRDELGAGGWVVVTSYNPVPFSRWGDTLRHHFETFTWRGHGETREYGPTETYGSEQEARAGHAVIVARLRTMQEAA